MIPIYVVTPVDSGDDMWVGMECFDSPNSCPLSAPFSHDGVLSIIRSVLIPESGLTLAIKCPEYIGQTREDILAMFPDLEGVDSFTDWETGDGYERPRLLEHSWDL